ncbi:class I SAM-dependent methyltransferase [candidate division WOR-3 bacterium]|nr:class I SAM-dependent methyltransferase [candidate division WOR-3 bacterium]
MQDNLYDLPIYYDIAFSWDNSKEIEFFGRMFRKFVPLKVTRILEPACGTGRFLVSLPRCGYKVLGYDNNPLMVEYSKEKILALGLEDTSQAVVRDMRSARFDNEFDSAINAINSIGYLSSDKDILTHLRNTAYSIKKGGIYIIHLACAWNKLEVTGDAGWVIERDGVRVRTIWRVEREDHLKKLSYQVCNMEIDDHGKKLFIEDRHTLRLWLYEDLKALIKKSGMLELVAIYDEGFNKIPLETSISGELGNVYYVLQVI